MTTETKELISEIMGGIIGAIIVIGIPVLLKCLVDPL